MMKSMFKKKELKDKSMKLKGIHNDVIGEVSEAEE